MIQILISMMMTIPKILTMITRAYVFFSPFWSSFSPFDSNVSRRSEFVANAICTCRTKIFSTICFCVKIINLFLAVVMNYMLTKKILSQNAAPAADPHVCWFRRFNYWIATMTLKFTDATSNHVHPLINETDQANSWHHSNHCIKLHWNSQPPEANRHEAQTKWSGIVFFSS